MVVLTPEKIGDKHQYLADKRPDWRRSLGAIRRDGGPWACGVCGGPSYLIYRCSVCGNDLIDSGRT